MADLPPYTQPGTASGWNNVLSGIFPTNNLDAANQALNLTPEERALYLRHLQNLYSAGGVDQPDGSRSSLLQMNIGLGDKAYNLPTVWNGQALNPDDPAQMQQIMANVKGAPGGLSGFPSYASPFQAENRYTQMHGYMDHDTGAYLNAVRLALGNR